MSEPVEVVVARGYLQDLQQQMQGRVQELMRPFVGREINDETLDELQRVLRDDPAMQLLQRKIIRHFAATYQAPK